MNIFESLESLNVSEKCFNDIISIIEELLSEDVYHEILNKYGRPEYNAKGQPTNRAAELLHKRDEAVGKEKQEAMERERINPLQMYTKRKITKQSAGEAQQQEQRKRNLEKIKSGELSVLGYDYNDKPVILGPRKR